ncbi:SDR family NAD(P)-dependent oxidoreductase [Galactobacter valiniphilus]|uniref:SDR family NAD(P)-dependent oxidoreductase n=1 Tax=Galactobacter valiniphilus TaxID=2676122 RepID=UPI0037368BDE
MSLPLHQNGAIVTGAARGIGRAVAERLMDGGADVAVVDLQGSSAAADELNERARNRGLPGRAIGHDVDVRDEVAVRACLEAVVEDFGGLQIVVNNAGTVGRVGLEETTAELWTRDVDTNLRGTFNFIQAAVHPHMAEAGYGRIVNVSSISGIMGGPFANGEDSGRSGPAYAASKGGVIALTKWVAKEVGRHGITCNSVAPGPVSTAMTAAVEYPLENQAIKRMGTPEDIAEAVAYLASPAAGFVTGDVLKVCGGSAIG